MNTEPTVPFDSSQREGTTCDGPYPQIADHVQVGEPHREEVVPNFRIPPSVPDIMTIARLIVDPGSEKCCAADHAGHAIPALHDFPLPLAAGNRPGENIGWPTGAHAFAHHPSFGQMAKLIRQRDRQPHSIQQILEEAEKVGCVVQVL
ncbi:hypothetical protein [Gemmobacter sp. 24YEA27]|uniref:hypothetical protein n=1 Tax=Gemmobacter sp. 24YEA27 TaxID=3040672 RepID=UPI0024B32F3F|nr:hypothetical protein [Gemmobacter sp. 24YEA27]